MTGGLKHQKPFKVGRMAQTAGTLGRAGKNEPPPLPGPGQGHGLEGTSCITRPTSDSSWPVLHRLQLDTQS
ncbi:hypothetical protein Nepgr_023305 [Nepenthes gracilis]|uniref:Uncharacterized protein n=1 Tax=Nepenthes gracilis TaxID=150966 RepID=A0AAD3XXS1_NEPGR|nr:hypothetical protein Nepgr_023305 [Nepenthes gracilis]